MLCQLFLRRLYSVLLLIGFSLAVIPLSVSAQNSTSTSSAQEMRVSVGEGPMSQDEIMARVRNAYAKALDVDDVAADIDRRGINFALEKAFADKIRFFRAAVVTNAMWRADDRRKAIIAKPANPQTVEEIQANLKPEVKSLPFIEQARAVALAYVDSLPNFVVREQTQRYTKTPAAAWKLGDYLELEVSYVSGQGEKVKLKHQNGSFTNLSLDQIGGLTSTGQFAGQLEALFNPESKAEFVEQGKVDFYGQPCLLYSFKVLTKNSHSQLKVEQAQIITGYRGQIYIHRDTKQVLHMDQEAIDIPPDFPLSAASSTVDFGWVTLGGKDFLLPVFAQVVLTTTKQNHVTAMNCITFHKYGKFETNVTIDVDDKEK